MVAELGLADGTVRSRHWWDMADGDWGVNPRKSVSSVFYFFSIIRRYRLLEYDDERHLRPGRLPEILGWDPDELDPELRKSFEIALHGGAALALLPRRRGSRLIAGGSVRLETLPVLPGRFRGVPAG